MQTLRPPKFRSQWYPPVILLCLIALITGAISVAYMKTGTPQPPTVAESGYISGQSQNFLSPVQAATHLQGYLAVTLWAETTLDVAKDDPDAFPAAFTAPQPLACAAPTGAARTNTDIIACARLNVANHAPATAWTNLTPAQRAHDATRQLSHLWRATDPSEQVRITILWREGVDPTDTAAIQEVQEAYSPCADKMMSRRGDLVMAETPRNMADAWLSIAADTKACTNTVSARLFLPPDAKQTPERSPISTQENAQ